MEKKGLNPVQRMVLEHLGPALMQHLLQTQLFEVRVESLPNGDTQVECSVVAMSSNEYRNAVFYLQQLQKKYADEPMLKSLCEILNVPENTAKITL